MKKPVVNIGNIPKPIILIDGSSYFFRAFHALPSLTTSKGLATGAVYGVTNMVKRLLKDYQPEQIAIVFDAEGKTFRDEIYPEYKMQRSSIPDKLGEQFEPLKKILIAMGLPVIIIPGVEADDVIGTLAHLAVLEGLDVVISTSDKDFAQLVNDKITLINTMSNQILDPDGVKKKFGVTPSQIIDYLTLVGDQVDNIPGVKLCGPKTASKWLQDYQSLDNLLSNVNSIPGKIGESLRNSIHNLPLFKTLLTIKVDVKLPLMLSDLKIKPQDHTKLISLATEMEFKAWLKELLTTNHTTDQQTYNNVYSVINYKLISTAEDFDLLWQKLQTNNLCCFSILNTGTDFLSAEIVGIAVATSEKDIAYIALDNIQNQQLPKNLIVEKLNLIFENQQIKKIGYNLKNSYNIFKKYNIKLQGIAFDTMLEAYLLDSSTSLQEPQALALKYLGSHIKTYADLTQKGTVKIADLPLEQKAAFLAEDAQINLKLHYKLSALMAPSVANVLTEIEIPLLTVLANLEYRGVLIDQNILIKHGKRLKTHILELNKEAISLAGKEFNLNSPKQLQEILFIEQKLPIIAKTAKGQPSTAEAILQELSYEYRLPAVILEYRSLSKLVSTYIDALPKCINEYSKRIHTSYNQAVTSTGRLSSSNPNLQNIPIRSPEGRLIRKAFIAPPQHVLLSADYSQIELRIMAHLSQDKNLIKAFSQNLDIHAATASEVFQIKLAEVSHEHRRRAKAINFGLIYGMSAFGLAKQLSIPKEDAQKYIVTYFERYPGVLTYMQNTREQARHNGYVETLFGRRLTLPEINSHNFVRRNAAERAAINAPLQGSAADLIKKAMIAIDRWQKNYELSARMIMQVHDELVFEIAENFVNEATNSIRELMENVVQLDVPLQVSIGTGHDWEAAH